MKASRKEIGVLGIVLVLVGLLVAISGAVLARTQPGVALMLVFGGSVFYIPGGLLAVSHFGYQRGTRIYLFITFTRMVYALAAVITFVGTLGRPA